ncbi:Uncharacterised protein [Mycobacterium tuberculosis]|nr:Uncharacterised protein [Mycobacterium tuberculosis]
MYDISKFSARSGRIIKEDGSVVNEAEGIQSDGSRLVKLMGSYALKGNVLNVTTAGTRVQLPDYPCREVTIIARRGNTGSIFAGGSDVSSSVYGVELQAKDNFTFAVSNTNLIWIDASVSGEGISYVAI